MRILIACEMSSVVRDAFIKQWNYECYSVDLLPSESNFGPHFQDDVLNVINNHGPWDMMIAFPPCTDLAVSGARYFEQKRLDGRQQKSIDFFMKLANAPIDKICIENPVGIMSSVWRKPDQIIQPFQFGHPEYKKTCLWLKNLPLLRPTNILELPPCGYWNNQTPSGQNKLAPSENRAKIRSMTYPNIGEAMSSQWGCIL